MVWPREHHTPLAPDGHRANNPKPQNKETKNGSGWQPHNIDDDNVATLDEARNLALETIVQGALLGDIVATITDNDTGNVVAELD
jgi:hypothetical protein